MSRMKPKVRARATASTYESREKSTLTSCTVPSIAGCPKSIPKRSRKPKCGSSRAHLSASRTSIGSRTRMKRLAADCSTIPAERIRKTKVPAEPSRIGNSGASTSTKRLSIPRPESADIRCSTVATRTSTGSSCCAPGVFGAVMALSVEAIRVSLTAPGCAAIRTGGSRSVRTNTMPVSGGAGRRDRRTRTPPCRPIPVVLTAWRSVR